MKRYIRANKYTENADILFDDVIRITVDVDVPWPISAAIGSPTQRFPGVEQFKQDVLNILETKYHFDVIEDVYNGIRQKGYTTDRVDGTSVYFDTYFDLANSKDALIRLGVQNIETIKSGTVYCFIHIRFSDHELNDAGDQSHRKFIQHNVQKYMSQRPDIPADHKFEDEEILIDERTIQLYYDEAIERLENDLDARIAGWVRWAKKHGWV